MMPIPLTVQVHIDDELREYLEGIRAEIELWKRSIPWACIYTLVDQTRNHISPGVRADSAAVFDWLTNSVPKDDSTEG